MRFIGSYMGACRRSSKILTLASRFVRFKASIVTIPLVNPQLVQHCKKATTKQKKPPLSGGSLCSRPLCYWNGMLDALLPDIAGARPQTTYPFKLQDGVPWPGFRKANTCQPFSGVPTGTECGTVIEKPSVEDQPPLRATLPVGQTTVTVLVVLVDGPTVTLTTSRPLRPDAPAGP